MESSRLFRCAALAGYLRSLLDGGDEVEQAEHVAYRFVSDDAPVIDE